MIVMDKVTVVGMPDNEWAHILKDGEGKITSGALVTHMGLVVAHTHVISVKWGW